MDPQPFKERMLEIENLTDELQDAQANWLLDWGASQLDWVLKDVQDEETAGKKAKAVFALIRRINRMSIYAQGGSGSAKTMDELAADFINLAELAGDAFCRKPSLTPVEAQSAASHLPGLQPQIAVEFLARWALVACDLL